MVGSMFEGSGLTLETPSKRQKQVVSLSWPLPCLRLIETSHERDIVSLQVAIRESGDVAILDLRGRSTISGGESQLLSSHIQKLVADGKRKLLLNLTDLTQVDSTGVSIIARTYVLLRGQGGDLRLLRPGGHVLEVLKPLHLLEVIPSFEDEAQALASFRPRGYCAPS